MKRELHEQLDRPGVRDCACQSQDETKAASTEPRRATARAFMRGAVAKPSPQRRRAARASRGSVSRHHVRRDAATSAASSSCRRRYRRRGRRRLRCRCHRYRRSSWTPGRTAATHRGAAAAAIAELPPLPLPLLPPVPVASGATAGPHSGSVYTSHSGACAKWPGPQYAPHSCILHSAGRSLPSHFKKSLASVRRNSSLNVPFSGSAVPSHQCWHTNSCSLFGS